MEGVTNFLLSTIVAMNSGKKFKGTFFKLTAFNLYFIMVFLFLSSPLFAVLSFPYPLIDNSKKS